MPTPYIDRTALAELIRDHRDTGRISDALAGALMQIAGGVWDRYRFTADRDDFVQEVTVHLMQRPLEKADVQKHIFNYMTTCAIRFGLKLRDKAHGDRRRFETYAAELVEAGRPVPRSDDSRAIDQVDEWSDGELIFTKRKAGRFDR